ncbi:MAG: hypothetical protein IK122_03875 [Alphaproteobacteria bacterium]|nr:hypothetical protein [Alphaproteobacteria bacterium]
MKKLLGVSLVALMTAMPSLANAAGERSVSLTKLNASDPVATANLATTSYVGGAYKTTADKIDLLIDDTAVTSDGTYIKAGNSVSANLGLLDQAIQTSAGAAASLGDLEDLTTTEQNSIVGAINVVDSVVGALDSAVGDLGDLTTTEQNSIVGAINEVDSAVGALDSAVGDLDDLTTTNQTSVVGAINEVDSAVSDLENKTITYVESWATPTPVTKKLSQLPDFGS